MDWDFIIGLLIILFIILVIWARISKQTVKEVIMDIKDLLTNTAEDVEEQAEGVVLYE